jgi:hypothetical protein
MATERCISLDSPDEWRAELIGIPHAFAHTWESCYAMHLNTRFATYLYAFEEAGSRIVCPIAERRYGGHVDIVTPYGFSGFTGNRECQDFPEHWRRFAVNRGYVCGYVQLNPLLQNCSYFEDVDVHRYNTIYAIDLTQDIDSIVSGFDRGRRQQIEAIERRPSRIIDDRHALTVFLLRETAEFFRRRQASPIYQFSEETLAFLAACDNVHVTGAGTDGRVEGVAMAAYTPYIGEAFLQVSVAGGQHLAAEMVWHRLKFLKSRHIPWMSLGGGVVNDDGIAKFKARFGAKKLPLSCLKQVYRPALYASLCRQAGKNPDEISGYFPPYHNPRN